MNVAGRRVEERAICDAGYLGGGVAAVWNRRKFRDCAGYDVVPAGVDGGVEFGDSGGGAGFGWPDNDGAGDGDDGLGEGDAERELVGLFFGRRRGWERGGYICTWLGQLLGAGEKASPCCGRFDIVYG